MDKNEIEEIVRSYLNFEDSQKRPSVTSIEEVFEHLWGQLRSGFVHEIGINSIYNESGILDYNEKTKVISFRSNLSMSNFIFLCWKAIFRDLGYLGQFDSKFTEKELKDGLTIDGTKLRY